MPSFHCLSYQGLSSFLSAVILVVGHYDIYSLVVGYEFPYSITCQNQEFISFNQVHFSDFWVRIHSNFCSSLVSKTPRHSKSWNIFMQMPNSRWTKRVSLHVSISSNSASRLDDSLLFIRLVSLVISIKRDAHHLVLSGSVWTSNLLSSCKGGS